MRLDCKGGWQYTIVLPMSRKRKLTASEKAAKKRRNAEFMTIFIHGKQKRVRRPPTIDGIPVDEFIEQNADVIWLHQNEMWELIEPEEGSPNSGSFDPDDSDVPF